MIVRELKFPIDGAYPNVKWETRQVGIREETLTDKPCEHCHGSGREVRGGRSMNCENGNHTTTCIGNTDPDKCICFCHAEDQP